MGCCVSSELQTYPISDCSNSFQSRRKIIKFTQVNDSFHEEKIVENVKKTNLQLVEQDKQMLNKILSEHFLLYRLTNSQRNKLIESLRIYQCKEGVQIFQKGDNATLFFIVRSGEVQIITYSMYAIAENKQNTQIKLRRGDYFGDLALIYTTFRSASAISLTKCTFFCASNQLFRKTVQEIIKKNYYLAKAFIQKTHLFKYLSQRQKNILAYNTLFLRFQKNQIIFKQGDDANSLYIITSGKVQLQISGKSTLQMKPGQSFGQNSFSQNQKRSGSAVALQVSCLLSISRQSLKKCLGNQLQQISFYNILKWCFNRNQILKNVTNFQRQQIISSAELKQCKNQEIICMQGEKAECIIIVLQEKINDQQVGSIFNSEYIMAQNYNDLQMTQRLVKNGKGYIAIIKLQTINSILGKNIYSLSRKHLNHNFYTKRNQEIKRLQLSDLIILSKYGESQFSQNYLVADQYKRHYTLKCVCKTKIMQKRMENFVIKQREIMKLLDNPYTTKLYKTFKDEHFVYFLTNNIQGADLFDILKQTGPLPKKKCQFFLSNIIIALQHLHEKNILYRSLKPENTLVDQLGFLNLVDFGIAKLLTEQSGFRTFTVIGTPHYMAPEVMEVGGYSYAADFWALGIVFYQIACGCLPFGNSTNDPYQIFKEIDVGEVQMPSFYDDKAGKEVILKLLAKNPHERFEQKFNKLKSMPYFENMDWEAIAERNLQAPFKIKQKKSQRHINEPLLKFLKRQKEGLSPCITSWDEDF